MPEPIRVETELEMAATPQEIYDAIVIPEKMAGYFISSGTGRLDDGERVVWRWDDVGAELEITPRECEPGEKVSFAWSATGIETIVVIDIQEKETGGCFVKVADSEQARDDHGIEMALQQMQGWMNMLCCLKAYLEHGINLRASPNGQKRNDT